MTEMANSAAQSGKLQGGISLVIPCHNEAENLQPVIGEALQALERITNDFEIVIVDDGSTDLTPEIVKQLMKYEPRIKLQSHPKNLGYGSALRSGFEMAEKDYIFFTDADRQFKISEISELIPHLDQSPMVIGYRENRQDPLHRRIYGRLFSFLIRLGFGIQARDVNCAFKIFDRKILEGEKLISPGALINAELLSLAKAKGIEPIQVPVSHFPRKTGRPSGGSVRVILRAVRESVRLYFHRPGKYRR